jgi:hypothetical protein
MQIGNMPFRNSNNVRDRFTPFYPDPGISNKNNNFNIDIFKYLEADL